MRIRCIKNGTNEVVGSFDNNKDMKFFDVCVVFNTVQESTKEEKDQHIINTETYALPLLIYHIDNENNPLEAMVPFNDNDKLVSTRWELFLVIPEQYIGKLPDWQKIPPKRIIEL